MRPFFSPSQLLDMYRSLICSCMELCFHIWGGSTPTVLLIRVEFQAFCLINSPPLTDCLDSLSQRRNVASLFFTTTIFILTVLLYLLTACLNPSRRLAAQSFLFLLIFILSIFLMEELISIYIPLSFTLVNSGTLSLSLLCHLSMT